MRGLNPEDIDQLITISGMIIRTSQLIPEMRQGGCAHRVSNSWKHDFLVEGRPERGQSGSHHWGPEGTEGGQGGSRQRGPPRVGPTRQGLEWVPPEGDERVGRGQGIVVVSESDDHFLINRHIWVHDKSHLQVALIPTLLHAWCVVGALV